MPKFAEPPPLPKARLDGAGEFFRRSFGNGQFDGVVTISPGITLGAGACRVRLEVALQLLRYDWRIREVYPCGHAIISREHPPGAHTW